MATKDPFSSIPPIPASSPQPAPGAQPAASNLVEEAKTLTKGATPRNLLKNIQTIGMPLLFLGVVAWVFIPTGQQSRREAPETEKTVDQAVQVSNTSALLDQLQDQANKAPAPKPPEAVLAGQQTGNGTASAAGAPPAQSGSGLTPMNGQAANQGYTPAGGRSNGQDDPAAVAALAAQKREEDRRASPLVSPGDFKLADEQPVQAPKSNATQLQEDMARLAAQQNAATLSMGQDARDTLAALNRPQTQQGGRNANSDFLSSHANDKAVKPLTAQAAAYPFMVFEGTIVRTTLLPDVSSDMPGKITAQVTSNVYDSINQREILIPKGSRLIGAYNNEVAVGQERTLIAMTRMILPDGRSISLGGASASDVMGRSGLKADVNNHFFKMFSTSFIIGASSFFLGDSKTSVQTTSTGAGNTTTGSVAGLALNDAIQTLMNRNKNIPPTLSNAGGTEFMFMVQQDMALAPYRAR